MALERPSTCLAQKVPPHVLTSPGGCADSEGQAESNCWTKHNEQGPGRGSEGR